MNKIMSTSDVLQKKKNKVGLPESNQRVWQFYFGLEGRLEDRSLEIVFDLRPECKKRGSHRKNLRQGIPGGGKSRSKDPQIGMNSV